MVPGEGKKQSTIDSYTHAIGSYLNPTIGKRKLASLAPSDVRHMLAELEARGLSANTRRIARATLRRSLRIAEMEGLVERNVAKLVDGAADGRCVRSPRVSELSRAGRRQHSPVLGRTHE